MRWLHKELANGGHKKKERLLNWLYRRFCALPLVVELRCWGGIGFENLAALASGKG